MSEIFNDRRRPKKYTLDTMHTAPPEHPITLKMGRLERDYGPVEEVRVKAVQTDQFGVPPRSPRWLHERISSGDSGGGGDNHVSYPSLVESVREHGVQKPVLLGEDGSLHDGNHRWAASYAAGRKTIPARRMTGARFT